MRALIVSPFAGDAAARGRLHALRAAGCTVAVAVPANWPAGAAERPTWSEDAGIRVVPVPVRGDADAATLSWSRRALRTVLTEFRPDLVQVEAEPWWPLAAQVAALTARLRVPMALLASQSVAEPRTLLERLRRGRVLRSTAGLAAINRPAARLLAKERGDLAPAIVPLQAVEVPATPPARRPHDAFTIGFVGRLVPERGLDLLFRASVRLRGDWTIQVVGTGPAQEELEQLAERLGIGSRVTWLGGLPRQRVGEIWPGLDCLVLPARTTPRWVESVGLALLEGMAHGVPVVATESGALPDVVGDAGILVPEEDPDALGLAVERLKLMPEERARLATAGRRRAMAEFTDAALARRTLAWWQEVLAARQAPATATP